MKEKIYIEQKDYSDRQEFRICIEGDYPKALDRKGIYKRYLSYLETLGFRTGQVDYVFIAYKKNNWFKRWFGNDYRNQSRIAIQSCDKLIDEYKKEQEKPKITKFVR